MNANASTRPNCRRTMATGYISPWSAWLLPLLWLSACAPAAPRSSDRAQARSNEHRVDAVVAKQRPKPASAPPAPVASKDAAPAPASKGPESASTESANKVQRPSPSFESPDLWYCLGWVHGSFSTEDCYPSYEECRAQPVPPERVVWKDCLSQKQRAWCTEPYDSPPNRGANVRCFGRRENCEMYRSQVGGNGNETSECAKVPTKHSGKDDYPPSFWCKPLLDAPP